MSVKGFEPTDVGEGQENEEFMVTCEGVGAPLFVDFDQQRKFYTVCKTEDLTFQVGDCARIKLADDGEEGEGTTFAFAQLLAIYEKKDEFFAEIRWFNEYTGLSKKNQKSIKCADNELIETDLVQDIPAGSVHELIEIEGANISLRCPALSFVCQYLEQHSSKALQQVQASSLLQRGMGYSEFASIYEEYIQQCSAPVEQDIFSVAIQKLHVNVIPDTLLGREGEQEQIRSFMRSAIAAGYSHAAMYIYGFPGTGKTASVKSVVQELSREVEGGRLPNFRYLEVNCLKLKTPKDAYTLLWRGISGQHCNNKTALKNLTDYFEGRLLSSSSSSGLTSLPIVCLVDELDFLLTKDFSVVYTLFEWPLYRAAKLIIIAIANTMNLPESFSSRVSSRAKASICKLVFTPYTYEQVQKILSTRLKDLSDTFPLFDKAAQELLARKAAHFGGDLRKALQLCRIVLERYRGRNKGAVVEGSGRASNPFFLIIKEVVDEHKMSPFVTFLSHCCLLDQVIVLVLGRYRKRNSGSLEDQDNKQIFITAFQIYDQVRDFLLQVQTNEFYQPDDTAGKRKRDQAPFSLPPMFLFLRAIERLEESQVLVGRKVGAGGAIGGMGSNFVYMVNSHFTFPDICAGLEDSWLSAYTAC